MTISKRFLSVYTHIGQLEWAYKLTRRHDQSMALWELSGKNLTLQRYWEFERISGVKGHGISFESPIEAKKFINKLLSEEGLSLDDMQVIIGTEGLSRDKTDYSYKKIEPNFSYHSLCHIYSGVFVDSSHFYNDQILCLALDAGPDHVLDPLVWDKFHYLAAYVNNGRMQRFPVPSPAIFWALLREQLGRAEGTLMALGSASRCQLRISVPACPRIMSLKDRYLAIQWVDQVIATVRSVTPEDCDLKFTGMDDRFSFEDNQISMIVKVIHENSLAVVTETIEQALKRFDIEPASLFLSMTGGFALNCPINSLLMKKFGFKGFLAPPVVNDSGMALGMGLHYADHNYPGFSFRLGTAYYGKFAELNDTIVEKYRAIIRSVESWNIDTAIEDLLKGPITWFDGAAEIGPRALGHRSLLADPREEMSKTRLNEIKQREWWRPVAPIVDSRMVNECFDIDGDSPFMLQAVPVRDKWLAKIPAVCHLDGTARVQTLKETDSPRLAALIQAFYQHTNVPMLCNTSLNDKDEPIIDSIERCIVFSHQKRINVAYVNGARVELNFEPSESCNFEIQREKICDFFSSVSFETLEKINPYALTREELAIYCSDPRLQKFSLTNRGDVDKLRKILRLNQRSKGESAKVMNWES
jgi:carbamoyltransferase